ncbi:hypothetical protein D1872_325640 [compost metagenome]
MLKPETQKLLTSMESTDGFFTPLIEGVPSAEGRRQDGTFLLPSAKWASEHEVEIKTWFADQNIQ